MTPVRIVIGIATRGRADSLVETLRELQGQTRPPDRIIVSHVADADITGAQDWAGVTFLKGGAGLARQRNTILEKLDGDDIILFLDDDFLPAPRYIEAILSTFATHPDVVITTGRILADGARGPGLSLAEGRDILAQGWGASPRGPISPTFSGYGCNMAMRLSAIRQCNLTFDERLPLYGWYEDVDFCRRLSHAGRIVEVAEACGVHLGAKSGRTSGLRLGYSQVVNPFYLWRKGSYPLDHAVRSVTRHLLINSLRSARPEPWVDRRGRLFGNSLALLDILRGRARPERILEL
jgi:GT2 family glycosyltransferase